MPDGLRMPGAAPSTGVGATGRASIAARTLRRDRWWLSPLLTVSAVAWILYATVRAASQRYYWVADYHYLTPFASPCLSTSCAPGSSHFGTPFGDFPPLVPVRHPDAAVPAAVPADLLLLPQGLLPRLLAVAAGLRGGRAARDVHR